MEMVETVQTNPRSNVQWPILYRGEDFVVEGTIVDLSLDGGRFAGTMPVAVGMHLALFIDSPLKNEDLIIEDAIVMCAEKNEFEAQFTNMQTEDRQLLRSYLENADRRHSHGKMSSLSADTLSTLESFWRCPSSVK